MKYRHNPDIAKLQRVRVGQPDRHLSTDLMLDRNERAAPFDDAVMAALAERLSKLRLNLYPELEPFYTDLAGWLGVERPQLFVTEGVSGAIKSVLETLAPRGCNVVFPTPTFALYPVYCAMFGLEIRNVGYRPDFTLDLDALKAAIDDDTAVVFLPNPNVPIEGYLDLDQVADLARLCEARGAILAVDEVYWGFGGDSAVALIDRHPNVLVLRSFSKAFGLAGIRVGYLIGPEPLVDYVSKCRTGYETNSLAAETVRFFLENRRILDDWIAAVKEGFALVKQRLDAAGLRYCGGERSNFIYIDLGDHDLAAKVAGTLRAQGIHIRSNWPAPWDRGISITGADPARMGRCCDAMLKAVAECRRG